MKYCGIESCLFFFRGIFTGKWLRRGEKSNHCPPHIHIHSYNIIQYDCALRTKFLTQNMELHFKFITRERERGRKKKITGLEDIVPPSYPYHIIPITHSTPSYRNAHFHPPFVFVFLPAPLDIRQLPVRAPLITRTRGNAVLGLIPILGLSAHRSLSPTLGPP